MMVFHSLGGHTNTHTHTNRRPYQSNGPYLQLCHKIKMAAIFGGLCIESLWKGYHFAMNDIKKSTNISGEAYTV